YRQVKSQVSARLAAIRKLSGTEKLVQQGQAINQQLNAWEQQLIQPSQKTFQDVINFPNRLNAQLVFLAGQLDTNDPQTTQGCRDRLAELVKQWETQKSALQAIVGGPIAQFNQAYRAQDLPALIIPDSNDK
ncbi:MAG: glycosyl hydrolase, partial [Planctomycetaceae bacterium]|nr:glycosyl hydrolase [Planctomycetaceae bacterium]